jgi:aminoglycoside 6'-N-acetyltransferase
MCLSCPVEPIDGGVLSWRPLTAADLPLLAGWLREEQVLRDGATTPARRRSHATSARACAARNWDEGLLVSLDGRPIGLLQRSLIHDYPEDLAEFAAVVDVSRGRGPAREEGSGSLNRSGSGGGAPVRRAG